MCLQAVFFIIIKIIFNLILIFLYLFYCAKFFLMDILKIRCTSQMWKNELFAAGTDKVLNDSALQKRTLLLLS